MQILNGDDTQNLLFALSVPLVCTPHSTCFHCPSRLFPQTYRQRNEAKKTL